MFTCKGKVVVRKRLSDVWRSVKLWYAPRVPEDGVPHTLLPPDTLVKGLAFGFLNFPSSECNVLMGAYGKRLCISHSFNFLASSFDYCIPVLSLVYHTLQTMSKKALLIAFLMTVHLPPPLSYQVSIHRYIKLHCSRIPSKTKELNLPDMSMHERRHNI